MRDVAVELKGLRLYGMVSAWGDLMAQGGLASLDSSRWLIEHLLQAESTDRAMRSISYQMKAARFPIHRDLAGFDFAQSCVDQRLISELADLNFTEDAHNVVLMLCKDDGLLTLCQLRFLCFNCLMINVNLLFSQSYTSFSLYEGSFFF